MSSARSKNGNAGGQPSAELAQEQLRALVNALPAGVMLIDAAGPIGLANPALERMFGYLPGELIGLSVELLVPPEQRGPDAIWWASGAGSIGQLRALGVAHDLRGVRPDGSEFPVDVARSSVSAPTGELTLLLVNLCARAQCVDEWLTRAVTCPLCKMDLKNK